MAPARSRIRAGSRWTAGAALLAAGDWARTRGLDARDAVLVHDGQQVLVRLGDVALTVTAPRDAERVRLARQVLGVVPGLDLPQLGQPHETTVGTVTATPWLVPAAPVEPAEVGALLRRWHHRSAPAAGTLPSWAAADATRPGRVPDSELGEGVLHGAVRPSRLARWRGRPVLLGIDAVCRGPRELDLVPLALLAEQGALPGYTAFTQAYGHDVRRWGGFEAAAELMTSRDLGRQVEQRLRTSGRLEVPTVPHAPCQRRDELAA